jgi:hypothetical protein
MRLNPAGDSREEFFILKKLFGVWITLIMAFVLVGCSLGTTTTTTTTTQSTTTTSATIANAAPVINGATDKTVRQGDPFDRLEGITATDVENGDLTSAIVVSGNVNVNTLGEYTVTLSVTDLGGKTTTVTYKATVIVKVLNNAEKATIDLNAISFASGINMPAFGSNGTYFYWSSSNPRFISNRGFIINPPVGSEPVVVTLTVRAVNGSYVTTKDFEVTVQPSAAVSVTSKRSVDFEGTSEEYVVANQTGIDLYFVNNGNVPYIDAQTFVNMIDGALDSTIISFTPVGTDGLRIEYSVEYEDFDGSMVTADYWAYIDFTLNTFTVNNFDFFSSYVASTESDYGEGLNYIDADYVDGEEVTIPLGDYNFDIVTYSDNGVTKYLMPLAVTNLLFAGNVYYDVYYNGDKLWGIDTFGISGGDEADLALQDEIRTSSFNSLVAPKDIRWATFHFLALALDYFYGLKEDKQVESFYDILVGYAPSIIDGSDYVLYRTIFDIAYKLDDLHTSHVFPGYYEPPYGIGLSISDLSPGSTAFYNGLWAVQDLLEAKWGSLDDIPEFSLIDDDKIAIIHLQGFSIDTPDAVKAILEGLPATVDTVVIDLSYNTGGNLGAVLRIFGYMTEQPIMYHSQNPADGSAATYYIESDYVAYDFNWYILTSSVTFSAANLMASMAKEQGIATVIGKDSSGGASSIGVIMLPDGSSLMISTNNVLSTRIGNEVDGYDYVSIEYGIEVEIEMNNVASDAELITVIRNHQAE